ncbi:hypothetical protein [Streptomyces sp. NPDC093568]|uniref:hypothetical protein n=1 Tax=Streptomyces sp. NPDC093568 TaxID=3366041 RepID=UPI0038181124
MNWDSVILTLLGAFGAVTILLGQLTDVLGKVPELIRALHAVREAWRDGDVPEVDEDPDPGSQGGGQAT